MVKEHKNMPNKCENMNIKWTFHLNNKIIFTGLFIFPFKYLRYFQKNNFNFWFLMEKVPTRSFFWVPTLNAFSYLLHHNWKDEGKKMKIDVVSDDKIDKVVLTLRSDERGQKWPWACFRSLEFFLFTGGTKAAKTLKVKEMNIYWFPKLLVILIHLRTWFYINMNI